MVARLELYNGLAPIQEYGRHQTQANRKKKPQKEQHELQVQQSETEKADANFNDQYYDLDDDFIDDDDIGMGIQDEMGADLLLGDSNMFQGAL